jgi:hypothetical protein
MQTISGRKENCGDHGEAGCERRFLHRQSAEKNGHKERKFCSESRVFASRPAISKGREQPGCHRDGAE